MKPDNSKGIIRISFINKLNKRGVFLDLWSTITNANQYDIINNANNTLNNVGEFNTNLNFYFNFNYVVYLYIVILQMILNLLNVILVLENVNIKKFFINF